MMRRNEQKSTLDRLSPGSTRTTSDAMAPGHLLKNGLQGSVVTAREPGRATAKQLEPKRKTWTTEENQQILKCYYQAEPTARGFQKRMMQLWKEQHPESDITEQRLMDQRRFIIRNKVFTEVEMQHLEILAKKLTTGDDEQAEEIAPTPKQIEKPIEETNIQDEDLPMQQLESAELSDLAKMLKEKIENHIKENVERKRLPIIREVHSKQVKDLLTAVNNILTSIPSSTLYETNQLMYSTAAVITAELGYKMPNKKPTGTPKWKIRLENKIKKLRGDISNLKYLKEGKLKNKKLKNSLHKKYNLEEKTITETMEELKQRAIATAKKIERYEGRIKQYRENVQFRKNQHLFYRSLDENQIQTNIQPCKEKTLNFWKELWENPVEHNNSASWIKDIQQQTIQNKMENIVIKTDMVTKQAKKVKNWSAPGLDELHGYWLKHLTSLHHRMATQFDQMLQNATSEEWLTAGRTYLIMKDPEKGTEPNNYRPITCLPTTFKLFTRILANSIFNHLIENSLYPVEQKGNFKKSRGTKDQLLIDKMVLKNVKRRKTNLNMAWIDYKKAFDSLPHSWINTCLENFGISKNICTFLKANMQKWKTVLTTNGENIGEVNIRRGIFQGDSLSPLLFNIALIPLTIILRNTKLGYQISRQHGKINHLLYMDDLKMYAKSPTELKSILNTVQLFSSDIKMNFGLEKCAILSMQRGKMEKTEGIELGNGNIVKAIAKDEGYKYLGILEADKILNGKVKESTQKEYIRRVRKILKSKLNAGNIIKAINTWAVPVIRYSAGIINWTVAELENVDRKTRKLLNIYHALHPRSDIDRLYLPRKIGGRGLLQIHQTVEEEKRSLNDYVNQSTERLLQAVKMENNIKITETKAEYKEKQLDDRLNRWKTKALHGQHLKNTEGKYDDNLTWTWLKMGTIKKETEGLILAAQEQALQTNAMKAKIQKSTDNPNCRLCNNKVETVTHLICECSKIAQTDYKARHDRVAKLIHWSLCKKYDLPVSRKPWEHKVEKVIENERVKILWDFRIQTDRHLEHNTPDITVVEGRNVQFIDIAVPGDARVEEKELEKIMKYRDLAIETTRLWMKHVTVTPIVIGALGTMSKNFVKYISRLQLPAITPAELQKTALLGTSYILRRYLVDT